MRRISRIATALMLVAGMSALAPVRTDAGPNGTSFSESEYGIGAKVAEAVVDYEGLWERLDWNLRLADHMNVYRFPLSSSTEIYRVIGIRAPFIGVRRQLQWLVLREGYGRYRIIGDLGPIEDVRPAPTGMHYGLRDILITWPATTFDPAYVARYRYDGHRYVESR